MPKFLERKLEKEYGKGDPYVYATMNKLGYMRGDKETAKGRAATRKHERDLHAHGKAHTAALRRKRHGK